MTERTDEEKAELLKALEALVAEAEQDVATQEDRKAKAGKDAVENSSPQQQSWNRMGGQPAALKTNLPTEAKPKGRLLQLQLQDSLPPKKKP